jgi:hypothetical protein
MTVNRALLPFLSLLGLLLIAPASWAAPSLSGVMIKDDTLRAQPAATAAATGQAAKGAAVEVLGRQAGWTQIKAGSATGWVRLLSVRTNAPGGNVADVGAILDRRENVKVVAVAGLRGLSEEELKGARFDARELAMLDRFKVNRQGAQQYAQLHGLHTRNLEHLPKPKPAKQESGSDSMTGY